MALQKTKEVDNLGISGDYWRIIQNNLGDNTGRVVTLQLYVSQAGRDEGKNPLNESVQFVFREGDHPLSELDESLVDTTLVTAGNVDDWYERFIKHCLYVHIKQVAQVAQTKTDNGEELTGNETKALFFIDAVDVL